MTVQKHLKLSTCILRILHNFCKFLRSIFSSNKYCFSILYKFINRNSNLNFLKIKTIDIWKCELYIYAHALHTVDALYCLFSWARAFSRNQRCGLKAERNTSQEGSVHPATYPTSTHLLFILYAVSHDIYPAIPEILLYFGYAFG